jgi:hypothetical protein
MAFAQARELELLARHLADAQHRATTHGAAFRLEVAAVGTDERKAEAFSPLAQAIDVRLEVLGFARPQPGAEAQNAARR